MPIETRRRCHRVFRSLACLGLVLALTGCATGGGDLLPVAPLRANALAAGRGYVLVHVVTDVPLASVRTSGGRIARSMPRGSAAWLVELPAGSYSWRSVVPADSTGTDRRIDLRDYRRWKRIEDWVWDDEYEFDVVAGHVNYPGTLIVRSRPDWRSQSFCCFVRVRNRSAMALRAVLEDYEALIETLPLRHGGAGKDGFLGHYSEVRDRVRRSDQEGRAE